MKNPGNLMAFIAGQNNTFANLGHTAIPNNLANIKNLADDIQRGQGEDKIKC